MMVTLNELFGVGWIVIIVVFVAFLVDLLCGRYWFFRAMAAINLDRYSTLLEKYKDLERDIFREERYVAYDNYSRYLHEMLVEKDWETAKQFRKAKAHEDYLTLYYMELAWDGDDTAEQWLEKDWEE